MQPIVECLRLKKHFRTGSGTVRAVDGVSFRIRPAETVGLVGESGCGKSTIGRTILKLIEPTDGQVLFDGRDIFAMNPAQLQALRREMGIIFQDPYSALNPRMKVLQIVGEPLKTHGLANGERLRSEVVRLIDQVGLKEEHLFRFPHQFSGGQRQRIAIARSLALNPRFLIFDEPTSALDVSV
jgi:peptide/nickel transport system ATP-binding protein/oligopeptide transport system ATP-binding protein